VIALQAAFTVARLAVIGFTSVATFGLSAILGFLPEIISGVSSMVSKFNQGKQAPKTLGEITNELDRLLKRQKEVNEELDKPKWDVAGKMALMEENKELEAQIKKLKELRQEKIKSSEDFGTGSMVIDRKVTTSGPDFSLPGQQSATIPMALEMTGGGAGAAKKQQEAVTDAVDAESEARIQKLKDEQSIILAEKRKASEEEIKLLKERVGVNEEIRKAEQVENDQERELAIQNAQLKNDALILKEQEYQAKREEEKLATAERDIAFNEEFEALKTEQRAMFDVAEQDAFKKQLMTKKEAEEAVAKDNMNRRIADRNQYLKDEAQFGKSLATLKSFFQSQEVQGVKETSGQLMQLQQSENSKMQAIGKAAAMTNAAIATAEGAIKAFTAMAVIPIVGPALGAAAAAALVVYGVEQQRKIASAATGGYVPDASGGTRDRVPMMTEPGELIVPKALAPNFIQAAGIPDTQSENATQNNGGHTTIEVNVNDRVAEFITLEQRQGRTLGVIK
jgi:hypothetical protein